MLMSSDASTLRPGAGGGADFTGAPLNPASRATARTRLFEPRQEDVLRSHFNAFRLHCEAVTGRSIPDATGLHDFSIEHFRDFWKLFLEWSPLIVEGPIEPVCIGDVCEHAAFFPNLKLNYVENLLFVRDAEDAARPALTVCHGAAPPERLSREQLRDRVLRVARAFQDLGLKQGDHVVAVATNNAEVLVGALAALSLGAVFASASPDMAPTAILCRFQPLSPTILMANLPKGGADHLSLVAAELSSLQHLVVLDDVRDVPAFALPVHLMHAIMNPASAQTTAERTEHVEWTRFPFNHPLFILFSSGTTGHPKCIVHSAGGTLLEHAKEHLLHVDLKAGDKLFFHTSVAWMMWNWQLSALACGTEIVLYDGPIKGPGTLWDIASQQGVTVLGTSPPYLTLCNHAGYAPGRCLDLSKLRSVLSTGSILFESEFRWFYGNVGDIPLQSISGGSDIIGCFVLGHPALPIYSGECQARSLGMDVRSAQGPRITAHFALGDLVCCNPFPSRPLGFYGEETGARFNAAYFAQNASVWTHGDLVEFTSEGTARIHGRSDSVLNVNGNRIGPGEIYHLLAATAGIRECMAVEQSLTSGPERSRLVLLVVSSVRGGVDDGMRQSIRRTLLGGASAAHVPALIVEVDELPVTFSNKRSERAVRDVLSQQPSVNADAIRNPECLQAICRAVAAEDARLAHFARQADAEMDTKASDPILTLVDRLWRKILRCPAAPTARWDEAGGDSLKLLLLAFELENALGREIALDRLRVSMTAAEFARSISAATAEGKSDTLPSCERLVFLFPGQMGDAPYLASLRADLFQDAHFALIKYPDWPEMLRTGASLERLAEAAEGQIVRALPVGDVLLLGYSLGGAVAAIVAERLLKRGRTVAFTAVLDTDVRANDIDSRIVRHGRSPGLWHRTGAQTKVVLRALRGGDEGLRARAQLRDTTFWCLSQIIMHRKAGWLLSLLRVCDNRYVPVEARFRVRREAVGILQGRAFAGWVSGITKPRLPGRLTLFRSADSRFDAASELGWAEVFDEVETVDVPGTHIEMLQNREHRLIVVAALRKAFATVPPNYQIAVRGPSTA